MISVIYRGARRERATVDAVVCGLYKATLLPAHEDVLAKQLVWSEEKCGGQVFLCHVLEGRELAPVGCVDVGGRGEGFGDEGVSAEVDNLAFEVGRDCCFGGSCGWEVGRGHVERFHRPLQCHGIPVYVVDDDFDGPTILTGTR